MKNILRTVGLCAALLLCAGAARGQAIKTNIPLILAGTPNAVSYTHLTLPTNSRV